MSGHCAPQKTGIGIGIVETDKKFRCYLAAVIDDTPGLTITGACSTGKEALICFEHRRPDVLLASLALADMSGTGLIWQARQRWPDAASLVMVSPEYHDKYFEVLEAGASGCLSKPFSREELVDALWTVSRGGAVLSPSLAKTVADHFRARGAVARQLTRRQRQVLGCLSCGRSQQQTALELGVTYATIRNHVGSLRAKLGAHSTTGILSAYFNPKDSRSQGGGA
jgi:DNA-binding NarL/FixJ family response regulator